MRTLLTLAIVSVLGTSSAYSQCVIPFFEDFETSTQGSGFCPAAAPFGLPPSWSSTGTTAWVANTGATGSAGTGPAAAASGVWYAYVESSCGAANLRAELEGPCIFGGALVNPTLDFQYHMSGAAMGTLQVQVLNPACGVWETVWERSGDQGAAWLQGQANIQGGLSAAGELRYRFVGILTAGFTSDMALDDISTISSATPVPINAGAGTLPEWEVNDGTCLASDLNGVLSDGTAAAVSAVAGGAPMTLSITGTPGNAFDALIVGAPPLSRSSGIVFTTAAGQVVNLNLVNNTFLLWLNGGPVAPALLPLPGAGLSIPFAAPAAPGFSASTQTILADLSHPDGFRLSQASGLSVQTCAPLANQGPLGDDTATTVSMVTPFQFYGTSYTDIHVSSNGNLTFTNPNTDFSSSEAEFLSAEPRIGVCWDDFNPVIGGSITYDDQPVTFSASWSQVPTFGATVADDNTFCVQLDKVIGMITITHDIMGLNGGGSVDQIVGISPGGGLSVAGNIDLSATATAPFLAPAVLSAIYEDFSQAAFGSWDLTGFTTTFTPAGGPGLGPYTVP